MGKLPARRTAYGRRAGSCQLVDDVESWPAQLCSEYERRSVHMPHGGERWLVACPWCKRWVIRLYYLHGLRDTPMCRHCAGLKYPSQYQGRRPEASEDRLDDLFVSSLTARTPAACERRGKRWEEAARAYTAKERRFLRAMSREIDRLCERL